MEKRKTENLLRLAFLVPAAIYLIFVLRIVFLKDGVRTEISNYRLVPLGGLFAYARGEKSATSLLMNYAGNIAMFVPLGIFLPIFFKKLKFSQAVLLGAAISAAVELVQFFSAAGYADIDDIIMNTVGTLIGAFIYYYIFCGRKKSLASYLLSLVLVIAIEAGAVITAWYFAPNILPDSMAVMCGKVAGRDLDGYDVRLKCYKMSHGEVFIVKDTAEDSQGNRIDKGGTYFISDTAIFITEAQNDYRVIGLEDMIKKVSQMGGAYVKIWLSPQGDSDIIMLEE